MGVAVAPAPARVGNYEKHEWRTQFLGNLSCFHFRLHMNIYFDCPQVAQSLFLHANENLLIWHDLSSMSSVSTKGTGGEVYSFKARQDSVLLWENLLEKNIPFSH